MLELITCWITTHAYLFQLFVSLGFILSKIFSSSRKTVWFVRLAQMFFDSVATIFILVGETIAKIFAIIGNLFKAVADFLAKLFKSDGYLGTK